MGSTKGSIVWKFHWRNGAALSLLLGSMLGGGCAVLTKSQVREVNTFARAVEGYSALPGEPIRVYAMVDRVDRILIVSARNLAEPTARGKAWEELVSANRAAAEFADIATRADRTLDVLDAYARLLIALSSDQFTDSLDTHAASLGRSLDAAIDQYNATVRVPKGGAPLGPVGGAAAAIIRGTGGIWIRHRQARLLQTFVAAAQPVMTEVNAEVGEFLTNRVSADLDRLENRLRNDFDTAGARVPSLPVATWVTVADAQREIGRARQLCRAAAEASKKVWVAHTKLTQNLATRRTLKSHLEEIEALAQELKQVQRLFDTASDRRGLWKTVEAIW